jgi:hypothetical protein
VEKKMKTHTLQTKLWVFALTLTAISAHGADSGPVVPLTDEDRQAIEQYLGNGIVGQAIPAPPITDTTRYLLPESGARTYRLVAGPDKGKTERHQPSQIKREGGATTWRYDAGGKFIYFVTAKADGDYVVTGVTDTDKGAITQYSPAEPFMLQGLAAGQGRNEKLGVKVFDLSNPNEQTHEGSIDVNYRYLGAYKVKVPAGSFDAVLMKWTLKGKIGPASLDDSQYRFFAPDVGIVAAVEQLDVSAVLIYNRHSKVARVLAAKPK